MKTNILASDLPQEKASCANCTNNGIFCERRKKSFPGGHIKNSVTGEIGGIISYCVNYKGLYSR